MSGVLVARDTELDGYSLGDSVGDFFCIVLVSFPNENVFDDDISLEREIVGVLVLEESLEIDLNDRDIVALGDGDEVGDLDFPSFDKVILDDGVDVFVPAEISPLRLGENEKVPSRDAVGDGVSEGEDVDDDVGEGEGLRVS